MSDRGSSQRTPVRQSRGRRKGTPRGGRHGLSRPASVPIDIVEDDEVVQFEATPVPIRARRMSIERLPSTPVLSRDAEMAYIRADLRKLLVISGALLALMLAILVLAGR